MTWPFQIQRFLLGRRLPVRALCYRALATRKKSSAFPEFASLPLVKSAKITSSRHEQRCSFAAATNALRKQSPRPIAAYSAA